MKPNIKNDDIEMRIIVKTILDINTLNRRSGINRNTILASYIFHLKRKQIQLLLQQIINLKSQQRGQS